MIKSILILVCVTSGIDSLKILGLFPHPGKSHHDVFNPLLHELTSRGHQLTVVSHFEEPKMDGWTQISMGVFSNLHRESVDMSVFEPKNFIHARLMHFFESKMMIDMALSMCDVLTAHPQIHEILNNNEKFDVILIEDFNSQCALGIAHFIDAPVIALQSHPPMPWTYPIYGQPDILSFMPCIFLKNGPHMNFFQRLENLLVGNIYKVLFSRYAFIPERELVQKNLNRTVPPLEEIGRQKTAMLLSNTHFTLHGVKPLVPAIVEVSGMHITKTPQPLVQEFEQYMNASKNGVIIFSMGSMLKTSTLPIEKRDAFVDTFSKIDYDVIWKWEGEPIPNLPKNVLLKRWLPQFDLLNHPKTVAFISHGGLLGTTEAIHVGVPMLFIPVFADQGTNSAAAVEAGLGQRVLYRSISKENVYQALTKVLSPEMRRSAKELSTQWHDRTPPLKLATDTVEYVAKYGGKRLRSPALDLYTYEVLNLDVYAFLLAVIFIFLGSIFFTIRYALNLLFGKGQAAEKKIDLDATNNNTTKYKMN